MNKSTPFGMALKFIYLGGGNNVDSVSNTNFLNAVFCALEGGWRSVRWEFSATFMVGPEIFSLVSKRKETTEDSARSSFLTCIQISTQ